MFDDILVLLITCQCKSSDLARSSVVLLPEVKLVGMTTILMLLNKILDASRIVALTTEGVPAKTDSIQPLRGMEVG